MEGQRWGPASPGSSSLVRRCHELRAKPLDEFLTEDLRIMIGQEIGLEVLVPMAVAVLEDEPLAEGDFFPGDLLAAVLRVAGSFWQAHPDLRRRVTEVVERVDSESTGLVKEVLLFRGVA